MSDALRCPVCSCAAFLALFAHETAGAARIRHSLRPLNLGGEEFARPRAKSAARMRSCVQYVACQTRILRCETQRARRMNRQRRDRRLTSARRSAHRRMTDPEHRRGMTDSQSRKLAFPISAALNAASQFSVVSLSVRFGRCVRPVQHVSAFPNAISCCFAGTSDNMRGHCTTAKGRARGLQCLLPVIASEAKQSILPAKKEWIASSQGPRNDGERAAKATKFYRLFSYCPYAFPLCQNWLRTLRMSDA